MKYLKKNKKGLNLKISDIIAKKVFKTLFQDL